MRICQSHKQGIVEARFVPQHIFVHVHPCSRSMFDDGWHRPEYFPFETRGYTTSPNSFLCCPWYAYMPTLSFIIQPLNQRQDIREEDDERTVTVFNPWDGRKQTAPERDLHTLMQNISVKDGHRKLHDEQCGTIRCSMTLAC